MPNYDAIAEKVAKALEKAGTWMSLVRASEGTFDPATGGFSGGSSATYAVVGMMGSQTLQTSGAGQRYFANTLVQTNDRFVTLSSRTPPLVGDKLVICGRTFNVTVVVPLDPGGTPLLFKVMVRE